ncbi:MAG: hypothetical protein ACQETD_04695, partial [Pseudomonadota bacterium]
MHRGSEQRVDGVERRRRKPLGRALAGLPGAARATENLLRGRGIDPDRLSILHLGVPPALLRYPYPRWVNRMVLGFLIGVLYLLLPAAGVVLPLWLNALVPLVAGLVMIQAACQALITATERFAARRLWDHYVAGTVAEILSTLPEIVVIAFVVPVSPHTAFVVALITIYNNTLVFSLYSYFLPKDRKGRFLMPDPITKAGTQLLISGAGMALTLGLVMLVLGGNGAAKQSFAVQDLLFIGLLLLLIFVVYVYRLVVDYASEEEKVRSALEMEPEEVARRREQVYRNVKHSSYGLIGLILLVGVVGAFLGGELVSTFAEITLNQLQLNIIATSLVLALFAGISEYVILWQSHRKGEYGIALANAFGGITQVMFLVFPLTLLAIAAYQGWLAPEQTVEPLGFSQSNILLLLFLFPTFYMLNALIAEDHTLGIL